jgi:hypothetical protein
MRMLRPIRPTINEGFMSQAQLFPCGVELEYLHCSPASGKRRQKGNPVPGGISGCHPVILALQVGGVLRIGTIKYGIESLGTQNRAGLRWRGPAATVNWSRVPDGCLTPRRTVRLTVDRNVTLTLRLSCFDGISLRY